MGLNRSDWPEGPSPRARGAVVGQQGEVIGGGSIPACAGSRDRHSPEQRMSWVHPRVRGEQVPLSERAFRESGPSPRARGAARRGPGSGQRPRVHPRVRGEQLIPIDPSAANTGPSPRARGAVSLTCGFIWGKGSNLQLVEKQTNRAPFPGPTPTHDPTADEPPRTRAQNSFSGEGGSVELGPTNGRAIHRKTRLRPSRLETRSRTIGLLLQSRSGGADGRPGVARPGGVRRRTRNGAHPVEATSGLVGRGRHDEHSQRTLTPKDRSGACSAESPPGVGVWG